MVKQVIVAVDGPAGSGKSSVSKEVARLLNLKYIDSGALYRSVTWFFLQRYDTITVDIPLGEQLGEIKLKQDFNKDGSSRSWVNTTEVTLAIRDEDIAKNIGIVSDDINVRNFVNSILRTWAEKESIIMDGRDIGTVVFPDADIKLYLDASVEIRALRRVKEYREMGKNLDENDIKKQIIQRDKEDTSRPVGCLVKAEDAIYIDTTDFTREEVINKIKDIIINFTRN